MFGIGGGIVKGPLMLEMGVNPMVAASTTAVMIFFTSIATTTNFIAFGTITWDYAWYLFIVGLFATTIGQFAVGYLIEKYQRYSFVSFSIGIVVSLSTILMSLQGILTLLNPSTDSDASSNVC